MKEITILSGKGGTGKTTITAALAAVARNTVFCDTDVDAADLHLIFNPEIKEKNKFFSGWKAAINSGVCNRCDICIQYCRFDAIHPTEDGTLMINPYQCEGCLLCEKICPLNAIVSEQNNNNFWYVSDTRFGTMVHAQMGPGEENSGKLVTRVRKRAREIAVQTKAEFIINDGPPGIGCAAISSLSGTDLALIVIEPTKSGYHDLSRLMELIDSFKIDAYAIINKYDINLEIAREIEQYINSKGIRLLARIPFDEEMVEAMVEGKTIVEYNPGSNTTQLIKDTWINLTS